MVKIPWNKPSKEILVFRKTDHFGAMGKQYTIIKRPSLPKKVSNFTPKMFFMISSSMFTDMVVNYGITVL